MSHRRSTELLASPPIEVYDVRCRAPRSAFGDEEWSRTPQVVLPRRGVFVVHRRGEPVVIDPNTLFLFGADDEYRVGHPGLAGDDCTVLVPSRDLLEDALGTAAGRHGSLTPRDHLAVCLLTAALQDGTAEPVEKEDAALLLLERAAVALDGPNRTQVGHGQRARVERTRALLAATPTRRWDLGGIALAAQCSPYHLARQFRTVTGETVSRYLLRLRLALAVDRLAEGEQNLGRLALELGFAHHSHFSARFRSQLGLTPSAARDVLSRGRLEELRTIVTAEPRIAA